MQMVRIEADYLLETAFDPRHAAEAMAGEQSSGTFVAVPGETPELKARAAARVESARGAGRGRSEPSLPVAGVPKARRHLAAGAGHAVVAARQYRPVAAQPARHGRRQPVRAEAVLRPAPARPAPADAFAAAYPGPKFGVAGTRRLAGVSGRPLIGTIIKPSVGFGPEETAASGRHAVRGRHRLHQGRRAAVGRPALPVRRAGAGRDAGRSTITRTAPARR